MRGEVLRRVLALRRRGLIGWSIGMVALVILMVISYPAVRDQQSLQDLMDEYPDFIQQILGLGSGLDITSPAGYLNSQLFTNTLPILLLIFVIGFAAREIAGEERDGTLDLTLAHPVTRTRVVIEKLFAMVLAAAWLAALCALALIVLAPTVDLGLGWWALLGATLSVLLLSLCFGVAALAIAALTGSRGIGIGVSSGLAVAMFVLWGLAPLVDAFEPTNSVNLFYWAFAGDPVLNGVQVGNALGMLATIVALGALAVWGLRRRDIGV